MLETRKVDSRYTRYRKDTQGVFRKSTPIICNIYGLLRRMFQ